MTIVKQQAAMTLPHPPMRGAAKPAGEPPAVTFGDFVAQQASVAATAVVKGSGPDIAATGATEEPAVPDLTVEIAAPPEEALTALQVADVAPEKDDSGPISDVAVPLPSVSRPPDPAAMTVAAPAQALNAPLAADSLKGAAVQPDMVAANPVQLQARPGQNVESPAKTDPPVGALQKTAASADLAVRLRLQVTQATVPVPMPPARAMVPPVQLADIGAPPETETVPKVAAAKPTKSQAVPVAVLRAETLPAVATDAKSVQSLHPAPVPLAADTGSPGRDLPLPPPQQPHALGGVLAQMGRSGNHGPIEIALAPDELGRVRLHMVPDGDNLRVTIMVERPETMDLFRRSAEAFLTDLRQAGFSGATLNLSEWGNGRSARPTRAQNENASEPPIQDDIPPPRPSFPQGAGLYLRL